MKRPLTAVTALLLTWSAGAFAGSAENAEDTHPQGKVHESAVESSARSDPRSEKSKSQESRDHKAQQGSELGTMGTGNTGTTGGMGATTGTDTIGGTIEE